MAADERHFRDGCCPDQGNAGCGFSGNALRVLEARYLKKNERGAIIETPQVLFERVADTVAGAELSYGTVRERDRWAKVFFEIMTSRRFMPNSPTLMNAGREMGMLSACFVLPVRDSVNDIFDAIKNTALIQKAGGGTGFAFDELRPTGDYIKSSGGTTSGPISFWRAFSEATNAIQQGAFRRGANMGMMYIHHPDILKFLYAKQDLTQFTNYNISVKLTDEWMEGFLAEPEAPHIVRNPRNGQEYVIPRDISISRYDVRALIPVRRGPDGALRVVTQSAADGDASVQEAVEGEEGASFRSLDVPVYSRQDIWDIIVRHAHQTGEPGVVFIDEVNRHNPTPHVGRIEATNPCGEQPLLPYEACNLGSINLACFVRNAGTDQAEVDWDALRETVQAAVRFLDDVIDVNTYPLPQIEAMCKSNRKIGLGAMGFADALYMLGVSYCSPEGVAWGERFMKFINDEAHAYSETLAGQRGCFPNWSRSVWDVEHHRPMRNSAATTVAPTGTISIITDCSCGIEPLFNLVFYRNVLKEQNAKTPMLQVNPVFAQYARQEGFYSEALMDRIAQKGTLAGMDEIPEQTRRIFVCARDVTPEWHIRMQAAFQKHCDSSISKTINFPHEATAEDVDQIYRLAYTLKCKGVTVYRDGCRAEQPMALKKETAEKQSAPAAPETQGASAERVDRPKGLLGPIIEPRDIPEIVSGLRLRQVTPFGNMHVKITVDPKSERELEVFAQLGKGGDLANSDLEAICRLISLWLRAGGQLHHVIRQLKDIGSTLQVPTRDGKIMSLGDGLARALQRYMRAKERFGLRDLLLGECDLSELHKPLPKRAPDHKNGPGQASGASGGEEGNGKNGNGSNGNQGNGKRLGRSIGGRFPEVRPAAAAWPSTQSEDTALQVSAPDTTVSPRMAFKVKCPFCGEALVFAEGCNKCLHCGWAQC